MPNFYAKSNKIAKKTELYLKSVFSKQNKSSFLIEAMNYGIFSGGKRFRSVIVSNTGKIFNINKKKLIIIGSAIECIHSYSLIHDDLPAMDNDNFRRGKPSMHKKYNEFTAILAGSSLLTLAFEILSSKDLKISQIYKNQLVKTLSRCSGHLGLAGGQYLDLTFENKKISKKRIINMQRKKTGELFGFCCESIGIIIGLKKKERKKLKEIGLDIGLLFQIVDDLIDYKGNYKIAGKKTNKDKKRGKATLINTLGYDNTLKYANNLKKNIIISLNKFGKNAEDFKKTIDFIFSRRK